MAGLGLVGLVRLALSRRGEAWVLVVSIVGTTIVPLGLFGDSRFKVPVMAADDHRRRLAVVPAGRPVAVDGESRAAHGDRRADGRPQPI